MKPSPDSSAHRKQGATVRRAIVSAAAAVASTTLCSGTRAASPAWQGATSADWFDPANWSTAAVPTGGDSALLPAGIPVNQPDISAGAARASELTIDNTEGPYTVNGTGTLTLVGGGITVTGGGTAAINPLLLPLSPATWSVAVDTTLQVNGGLAGIQPISQTGPGTLELNYVPSNFAGGFAIVGALQAGARSGSPIAAFRSNTITLNGGTLSGGSSTATQLTAGTIIGTGAVQSSGKKLNLILTEDGSTAAAITAGAGSGGIQMQGLGTQTFTGAIDLTGGVSLAQSANLVFAGESVFFPKGIVAPTGPTPSSPGNTTAAVVKGGTLVLDNSAINNNDRVQGSGYIQVSGGGGVTLIGNAAGTSEDFGDMAIVAYSGAGNVRVVHNAAAAPTVLTLPGLGQANTTATLDFSANVPFATGNAPRIMLGAPTGYVFWTGFSSNRSTIVNNTLGVEGTNGFPNSTGMFTVNNRNDFAAYDPAAGIVPVTTGPFPTAPGGDAAANALLSASATTAGTGGGANFALNTLKIAPAADNQTLTIDGDGDLQISGYILAGPRTFTISSTGGGKIAGRHTRYFHVADPNGTLVLNADLAGLGPTGTPGVLQNNPITKDGPGTLVFAAPSTFGASINVNILDGALRGTLETNTAGQPSTLPFGQTTVRFRGGVLEIYGGGVFSRTLGSGGGRVTWGGAAVEAGSGGFAAMNGSARVDLGALDTRDDLRWRQSNFVFEDQALFFGSRDADSVIEWYDNINLNGATNDTFPSAREFRVFDNPNSIGDKAVITGEIKSNDASSGGLLADLLKTGDGTLVLAASSNGYLGNTIVAGGTLQATGSLASTNYILKAGSFLPDGGVPTTANFLLKGGSVTFSSARTVITSIAGSSGTATLAQSPASNQKVLVARSIALTGSAKLDLANNGMVLDYEKGDPNPIPAVRNALRSAFAGGAWTGPGITTSAGAGRSDTDIGYADSATLSADVISHFFPGDPIDIDDSAILFRYTKRGDATLDGHVDFNDLVSLAQNYNTLTGNAVWVQGDFNYDGNVDFNDLVFLAQNYNSQLEPTPPIPRASVTFETDLSRAFAGVPEPAALSLFAACGLAVLSRPRRRRHRKE